MTADGNDDDDDELMIELLSSCVSNGSNNKKLYQSCTNIIINSIYLLSPSDLKLTTTTTTSIDKIEIKQVQQHLKHQNENNVCLKSFTRYNCIASHTHMCIVTNESIIIIIK